VLAEVAELTSQNQTLNKTFMALAGAQQQQQQPVFSQWLHSNQSVAAHRCTCEQLQLATTCLYSCPMVAHNVCFVIDMQLTLKPA
jgi:hypothetical protein